jgi:hypothetical protein
MQKRKIWVATGALFASVCLLIAGCIWIAHIEPPTGGYLLTGAAITSICIAVIVLTKTIFPTWRRNINRTERLWAATNGFIMAALMVIGGGIWYEFLYSPTSGLIFVGAGIAACITHAILLGAIALYPGTEKETKKASGTEKGSGVGRESI